MNGEPLFLTLDEVLRIHAEMIASFGGQDGVREIALLESEVAQPSSGFGDQYLYDGFARMAAAYLSPLPRTMRSSTVTKEPPRPQRSSFLKMNGIGFSCSNDELATITDDVGVGAQRARGSRGILP